MLSRRNFIKMSALGTFAVGAGVSKSAVTTESLELTRLDVRIKDLPERFQDYRIAFMGDLHLGPFVSDSLIEKAIEFANHEDPDLLLLGGDHLNIPNVMDRPCFWYSRNQAFSGKHENTLAREIYARLCSLLGAAKARDGIYAVYGNHDRWIAPHSCRKIFEANDIPLLINQSIRVVRGSQTLRLIGVDDYWTAVPRLPLEEAVKPAGEVRILLSHNPDFISETLNRTAFEFDLGLAGHTHGGQIVLPLIGTPLCNIRDRRLLAGLFRHERAQVYTTRGVGVVELPVRINCPPEVCVFTLKKA